MTADVPGGRLPGRAGVFALQQAAAMSYAGTPFIRSRSCRSLTGAYAATVDVEGPLGVQSVDARASDALNLAVIIDAGSQRAMTFPTLRSLAFMNPLSTLEESVMTATYRRQV